MDKKSFLEQRKPKVTTVTVDGQDIHLREPTIGDNNFVLFEKRAYLLDEAIKSGVELDLSDEAEVEANLKRVPDKFALARGAAIRICDPDGNLLFDAKSKDDLAALNNLGESLLSAIQEGTEKKRLNDRLRFQCNLALSLGKTLEEIELAPEWELEIWQEYHAEQPFGEWREDLRMGILASTMANTVSPKGMSPIEFMPFEKRAEEDFSDFLDGAISV